MKYWLLVSLFFSSIALQSHAQSTRAMIAGLDSIRTALKIPGMAVALMRGDTVLFEEGLGYADVEHKIPVTPNTTFGVASLTKTFTSTLIMQLVEQGKLSLDTPVTAYGQDLGNPDITVRNLLTHTSEWEPGTYYQYNGNRFAVLTYIIEQASGVPFHQLLMTQIAKPLHLTSTAPRIALFDYFDYIHQDPSVEPYFDTAFTQMAKSYALNDKGEVVLSWYANAFGAFGGLVTNVKDLLKYSIAIDKHQFVSEHTQEKIYTPNRLKNGSISPYGLGWFSQQYKGVDFYWHYGQMNGEGALFIKVPSRRWTMVVLTNFVEMSQPFQLGDGDLFMSPVGQLFYKYCIGDDADLYNKKLITQATMDIISGDTAKAQELYKTYASRNFKKTIAKPGGAIIASIEHAGVRHTYTKAFTLTKPTKVRIIGIGEDCSPDGSSWCDYGWIEDKSGKMIWQMQQQPKTSAGGAVKNQQVDQEVSLPAGEYILKYKSDDGHAYGNWDSLPPDDFRWGITVYEK
jgi:CubicO group peptidase (beta-lactamase class C family)